jgi:microcystin-dependent protein
LSRNVSGNYTLPLPPVSPGDVVESAWANTTLGDIGEAITQSLDRSGRGAMLAPLILAPGVPTQALQAASKEYVDSFLVYATGLAIGCTVSFAGVTIPAGFLECNGQAVSRTTYADLFNVIGTTYGSGDNSTTFNVPDMRDYFVRGKADSRAVGNKQAASFAAHAHPVSDPTHAHGAYQAAHNHGIVTGSHNHALNDPGHTHSGIALEANGQAGSNGSIGAGFVSIGVSGTGISIAAVGDLGGYADTRQPTVTVNGAATGISIGAVGGAETVPQNIAQIILIKAVNDLPSSIVPVTSITSSDDSMISIDSTIPYSPELVIHSNVAFGTVKLDAAGKVPLNQMATTSSEFLGYFDASSGNLPVGTFASGSYYAISVSGTLTVYDPVTLAASPTVVSVGSQIHYVDDSATNPTGWYYLTVSSSDVVGKTDPTGAAIIPAGTEAQRPPVAVGGYFRFNSDTQGFEGYNGTDWGSVGGGATGAPGNPFIYENDIHVTANYSVTSGKNAMSAGPIIVDNGVTVTVPPGSVWSII